MSTSGFNYTGPASSSSSSGNYGTGDDNPLSFLLSTAQSGLWHAGELFGLRAPDDIETFRAKYPAWDFLTQFASIGGTYGAGIKLGSKVPGIAKVIEMAGASIKSPIAAKAVESVVRLAPLEAARLGTAAAAGNDPFDFFVRDTLPSLGFEAGAGAIGGVFSRAGASKATTSQSSELLGIDPRADPAEMLRVAQSRIKMLETLPVDSPEAAGYIRKFGFVKTDPLEARNTVLSTLRNNESELRAMIRDQEVSSTRIPQAGTGDITYALKKMQAEPGAGITKSQTGVIKRLQRELGLGDEAYRARLESEMGVTSSKELTTESAHDFAQSLYEDLNDDGKKTFAWLFQREQPGASTAVSSYVSELHPLLGTKPVAAEAAELFVTSRQLGKQAEKKGWETFKLQNHELANADSRIEALGLSVDDMLANSTTPRINQELVSAGAESKISQLVKKNFIDVGDGWYLAAEKDGKALMAKKVTYPAEMEEVMRNSLPKAKRDALDAGAVIDEWFVTKTSTPEAFAQKSKEFVDGIIAKNSWARPIVGPEAIFSNSFRKMMDDTQIAEWIAFAKPGVTEEQRLQKAAQMLGVNLQKNNALVRNFKNSLDSVVTPGIHQGAGDPLVRRGLYLTRNAEDMANKVVDDLMFGESKLDPNKNAFFSTILGSATKPEESYVHWAKKLSEDDWKRFSEFKYMKPELWDVGLETGELSKPAYELLKYENDVLDAFVNKLTDAEQRAAGHGAFAPKEGHGIVGHDFNGDQRAIIRDEHGDVLYVKAGDNNKEIQEFADSFIAQAKKEGKNLFYKGVVRGEREQGEAVLAMSQATQNPLWKDAQRWANNAELNLHHPRTFRTQKGVEGFTTEWNYDTYTKAMANRLKQRVNYAAELGLKSALEPTLDKMLALGDTHGIKLITRRINDVVGKPGVIGSLTNELADRVLYPELRD